ncbi:hypothetical protein MKEN_00557900 [Mycena kentingensis (nom. inval.)]|nr:hypothetical protein MKEN_00557900 [Mycena kentingensis (nom. inval.)]
MDDESAMDGGVYFSFNETGPHWRPSIGPNRSGAEHLICPDMKSEERAPVLPSLLDETASPEAPRYELQIHYEALCSRGNSAPSSALCLAPAAR